MLNNNHNHSSCAFAEQLISYLYDESDAREKSGFETHLKSCPTCADELAGFGFVRAAVLDWQTEEFSKLPTPAFDVSADKSKESFSTVVVSTENRSWLDGFRQVFSFNPLRAAAAFGILIICFGILWLALNSSKGDEIAENGSDKNSVQSDVSPTVEIIKNPEGKSVIKDDEKSLPSSDVSNPPQGIKRQRQDSRNDSAVKVSSGVPKINPDNFARIPKESNESAKKTPSVRKKQIPNLNDAEDEEDETIRLADLFDELDAK